MGETFTFLTPGRWALERMVGAGCRIACGGRSHVSLFPPNEILLVLQAEIMIPGHNVVSLPDPSMALVLLGLPTDQRINQLDWQKSEGGKNKCLLTAAGQSSAKSTIAIMGETVSTIAGNVFHSLVQTETM